MAYAVGEYYESAEEYDLEYQSQSEQDVPFWRELVLRYLPQRALELACGSGRIGWDFLTGRNLALREAVLVDEIRIEAAPDLRLPDEIAVEHGKQRDNGDHRQADEPGAPLVPAMRRHERPEDAGSKNAEAAADGASDGPEETGNPVEHCRLPLRRFSPST